MNEIYSAIGIVTVDAFRMARYVIISANPEDDVNAYMDRWAKASGLLDYPGYISKKIGWDFPFVTKQQSEQFGLRGYVAAYVLPDGFEPACPGAQIAHQPADNYAKITITDPFANPFERIPGAYHEIFTYLKANGQEVKHYGERICFEEIREAGGVTYMDVYVPADVEK